MGEPRRDATGQQGRGGCDREPAREVHGHPGPEHQHGRPRLGHAEPGGAGLVPGAPAGVRRQEVDPGRPRRSTAGSGPTGSLSVSVVASPAAGGSAAGGRRRHRNPLRSESKWGLIYALPAVLVVAAFVIYPFGSIIVHSFTRWDGYTDPIFIGTRNFEALFRDQTFINALRNNVFFALSVPVQLVVPLCLAFLIHERIRGWRFFRWTY